MTIEQRLEFIRAGYSAADIREFEQAADFAHEEPAEPAHEEPAEPAHVEPTEPAAPAWATALQASIDKLTAATQRSNVLFDDMGGEVDRQTKATNAMGEYLTGKKAGKSK